MVAKDAVAAMLMTHGVGKEGLHRDFGDAVVWVRAVVSLEAAAAAKGRRLKRRQRTLWRWSVLEALGGGLFSRPWLDCRVDLLVLVADGYEWLR